MPRVNMKPWGYVQLPNGRWIWTRQHCDDEREKGMPREPGSNNHDEIHALWQREDADLDRFNAGLMTEAEVENCIAYWVAAARTCNDESAASEFSGFAEYLREDMDKKLGRKIADAYRAGKGTYAKIAGRYGLSESRAYRLARRYG